MNAKAGVLSCLDVSASELLELWKCGQWHLTRHGDNIVFGSYGRAWFKQNELSMRSAYTTDFFARNMQARFPVIMKFYPESFHLDLKRRYSGVLGKLALKNLESHFRFAAKNLFQSRICGRSVDLFQEVTRAVIAGQLELFFDLTPAENVVALLADYEDMFSLGLYSDTEMQDKWYAQLRFMKAEESFTRLHELSEQRLSSLGICDHANTLQQQSLGALSHFYNLSVAGSTNVAKLFCQIVESVAEMGERLETLIGKVGNKEAASCIVKEALRLLPWTKNQITQPFISRQTTVPIVVNGARIREDSLIHLVHCLEHLSETLFPSPYSFSPKRWVVVGPQRLTLYTFGIGRRKCCGEALVDIWLQMLVEEYLQNVRFETEGGIAYRPYNASICGIEEFSYRGSFQKAGGVS